MSSADPLLAVLAPPHVREFLAAAEVDADELEFDFTGWSKRVVLSPDRAFLFPRDHHNVDALRHEVDALRAVGAAGLDEVPRLLEVWDGCEWSPYPVVTVTRLPGASLDDQLGAVPLDRLAPILRDVARLAAGWHVVDPQRVSERPSSKDWHTGSIRHLLDPATDPDAAAAQVAGALDLSDAAETRVVEALQVARTLDLVLLHGDLHEAQLLVDHDLELTGVVDWQSAHVGHPYEEFDFGEWGTAIWRTSRAQLPGLAVEQWRAYGQERGLPDEHERAFALVWAVHRAWAAHERGDGRHTEVAGSATEWRRHLDDLLHTLGALR